MFERYYILFFSFAPLFYRSLVQKDRKYVSKGVVELSKFMSDTYLSKSNKVINYLESLPSFWWEAFVQIMIGKFIIFIRRKIINELHNLFVLC